jgi:predicted ATPase
LLAPLLDIPLPQERAPILAPDELRRRQLAALTASVMASARVQPVVLAIEDLHWADPTTLDVLRGIAERGALAPLFIAATTRPEFRPPWGMRSHHATISLAPLDRAQVRDMIAELSARHALTCEVVDNVAARTGGVPLFVEVLARGTFAHEMRIVRFRVSTGQASDKTVPRYGFDPQRAALHIPHGRSLHAPMPSPSLHF